MIRSTLCLAALLIATGGLRAETRTPSLAVAALQQGRAASQPAAQVPALAPAERKPVLRPELILTREIVTFGDLIEGLAAEPAAIPAFRAPALGETGTIQIARIVEAARAAGVIRSATDIVQPGIAQVVVTRAARRLTAADIETAIASALRDRYGVDARMFALLVDGGMPPIAVEPELTGALAVLDIGFDQRSRRVQARLAVPGSAAMRLKPLHLTGQLVETAEVVVPKRAIARGETIGTGDVMVERRPRDGLGSELLTDLRGAVDKVAKRALLPGAPLRGSDVQREEIVTKGDLVTIVYEAPGLVLSMRGRAGESGAMGDVVNVTNPQSKRVLQGTVSGPGRVSVRSNSAGRVASAR